MIYDFVISICDTIISGAVDACASGAGEECIYHVLQSSKNDCILNPAWGIMRTFGVYVALVSIFERHIMHFFCPKVGDMLLLAAQ